METTLKRAWQRLTRATPGKSQAELAGKYTHFQALLSANNQVLTLMADREEKLSGDYLFDLQYLRAAVSQLHQETAKLVDALDGQGGSIGVGGERSGRPKLVPNLPGLLGLTAGPGAAVSPPEVGSLSAVLPPGAGEVQGAGRDRSYAVLSENYLNLNLRLGYLRFTVEAHITEQVNDNYLTFGFRVSGSTPEFQAIRARLLEGILDRLDLSTRRKGDFLEARLAKYPPEQMSDCLTRLGRLTLYINQLDISLVSDSIINWYVENFIGQARRCAASRFSPPATPWFYC